MARKTSSSSSSLIGFHETKRDVFGARLWFGSVVDESAPEVDALVDTLHVYVDLDVCPWDCHLVDPRSPIHGMRSQHGPRVEDRLGDEPAYCCRVGICELAQVGNGANSGAVKTGKLFLGLWSKRLEQGRRFGGLGEFEERVDIDSALQERSGRVVKISDLGSGA